MERGHATRSGETCWALITPAPDLPGQWIAHCLNFDVVSQGNSPWHAFEMIREATQMVVTEDRAAGRDPNARRAPEAFWAPVHAVFNRGRHVEPEVFAAAPSDVPAAFIVVFVCESDASTAYPYPFAIDDPITLSA